MPTLPYINQKEKSNDAREKGAIIRAAGYIEQRILTLVAFYQDVRSGSQITSLIFMPGLVAPGIVASFSKGSR